MANPFRKDPPIDLRTWIQSSQFLLSQVVAAAAPFANFDYPNPRGAIPSVDLKTWINAVEVQLIGKDTFFGSAGMGPDYDYPNPRGAAFPSDLRTFINQTEIQLIGKDKIYGASGMVPDYDWPNPLGPRRVVDLLTQVYPSRALRTAVAASPFSLTDWPNPRGPSYSIDLRTFLNPVETQLIGKDKFFGLGGNVNFDWPNPRGYEFSVTFRTWADPLKLNLIGKDQIYGAAGQVPQYDYPNPRGTNSAAQTWISGTIALLNAAVPFAQSDWPNPHIPVQHDDLIGWGEGFQIQLQIQTISGSDYIVRGRRRGRR